MSAEEIKVLWNNFLEDKGTEAGIVIHCDSKEKANKLLNFLYEKGFKRIDGENYSHWEEYKDQTCYTGEIAYANITYYKQCDCEILKFDDIAVFIDQEEREKNKMKTYQYEVTVRETLERIIVIRSDRMLSEIDVQTKVENLIEEEIIILDADDFSGEREIRVKNKNVMEVYNFD